MAYDLEVLDFSSTPQTFVECLPHASHYAGRYDKDLPPRSSSSSGGNSVLVLNYDMCFTYFYSKDVQKTMGAKKKLRLFIPGGMRKPI